MSEAMREKFEKAILAELKVKSCLSRDDAGYADVRVENAWFGYQAAASHYEQQNEIDKLNLQIKSDEADSLRSLHESLIKECYSLDPEGYPDDGEYRYKWASLAIHQAKTKISEQEQQIKSLLALVEKQREALSIFDRDITYENGNVVRGIYWQDVQFARSVYRLKTAKGIPNE